MDTNTGLEALVLPPPSPCRSSAECCGRHHFATAAARARPGARERDVLEAAWLRWWGLAGEPGAWDDPDKRREMLRARLEYQDALLAEEEAIAR